MLDLKEKANTDLLRPNYHFVAPAGWLNDPNGLIFWRGKHHIFYQYNPHGAFVGTRYWGHAVSKDLVHWKHLPIALSPGKEGCDRDGCWSGSAVDNNGIPTIMYTGVMPEVQCLAIGDQEMVSWKKYSGNPVIKSPPHGLEVTGFRDPCVWKEDDTWYMIIGSGIKGIGGTALLYESKDLSKWQYLNPLCIGEKGSTGEVWECPDFFPLGNKYVLLISAIRKNFYFVGNYKNHKFYPEKQGILDIGNSFYAAKTLLDPSGRRILFGWVREGRSSPMQIASGWSGAFSLPRIMSLSQKNSLIMVPLPELKILRGKYIRFENICINYSASISLEDVQGDSLEIEAEFDLGKAKEFGFKVRCSPSLLEQTIIAFNQIESTLKIDNSRSSLSAEADQGIQGGTLKLNKGERLRLHIFLDKSLIEVFANDHTCLTSRIYPTREDSVQVELFARGGNKKVLYVDSWEIESAR